MIPFANPIHSLRRHFFSRCSLGIGATALAALMNDGAEGSDVTAQAQDPLAPRPTHFRPKQRTLFSSLWPAARRNSTSLNTNQS